MWIADAGRSREIDLLAQTEYGIPSAVLMERAGMVVFEAAAEFLPDRGRLTVVCGRGNNGGDGLVVARAAKSAGYDIECLVAAKEADLSDGARHQLAETRAFHLEPVFVDHPSYGRRLEMLGSRDLIVDALLGTGAGGEVRGPVEDAIRAINRSGVPVVSVDVPSGIHTDTGEELGESIWAMRTVTFGLPKPYLFQGIGIEHAGYWTVADIGFPPELLSEPTDARLLEPEWVGGLLPERFRASHKGENGSVLIVAGSQRMRGAAVLAARAAMRAGAGLITVASVESVCAAVAAHTPEALLLPLPESGGIVRPEAANLILDQRGRFHSALFGPGLTQEEPVMEFLDHVWREWDRPSCVDADALNCVAKGVALPAGECVLTPHPGEMGRLLNCTIGEVQSDRFRTVMTASTKFGKTTLLKGPHSIVGEAFQPMLVNCTGNPGMASAGMGDVLAGIVSTLLAQDLPAYYAAACGMFWHGAAGDVCAQRIGAVGFTALDVAENLPLARASITNTCDRCG